MTIVMSVKVAVQRLMSYLDAELYEKEPSTDRVPMVRVLGRQKAFEQAWDAMSPGHKTLVSVVGGKGARAPRTQS
jgi:hypothetical protein